MASVTVVVRPARTETKNDKKVKVDADLRPDRRGNPMINAQDVDTNQYITVYPFSATPDLFTADLIGHTVVLSGTLHPLGENVKMIAKTVDVVK